MKYALAASVPPAGWRRGPAEGPKKPVRKRPRTAGPPAHREEGGQGVRRHGRAAARACGGVGLGVKGVGWGVWVGGVRAFQVDEKGERGLDAGSQGCGSEARTIEAQHAPHLAPCHQQPLQGPQRRHQQRPHGAAHLARQAPGGLLHLGEEERWGLEVGEGWPFYIMLNGHSMSCMLCFITVDPMHYNRSKI